MELASPSLKGRATELDDCHTLDDENEVTTIYSDTNSKDEFRSDIKLPNFNNEGSEFQSDRINSIKISESDEVINSSPMASLLKIKRKRRRVRLVSSSSDNSESDSGSKHGGIHDSVENNAVIRVTSEEVILDNCKGNPFEDSDEEFQLESDCSERVKMNEMITRNNISFTKVNDSTIVPRKIDNPFADSDEQSDVESGDGERVKNNGEVGTVKSMSSDSGRISQKRKENPFADSDEQSDSDDERYSSKSDDCKKSSSSAEGDKFSLTVKKSQKFNKTDSVKSMSRIKPIKSTSAAECIVEVRREKQRMIREERAVLPYHRPKSRSLQEFLKKRSQLPSIPMKISEYQLAEVCKQLESRKEHLKVFYKSESSEDEKSDDTSVENTKPTPLLVDETDTLSNISASKEEKNDNIESSELTIQVSDRMATSCPSLSPVKDGETIEQLIMKSLPIDGNGTQCDENVTQPDKNVIHRDGVVIQCDENIEQCTTYNVEGVEIFAQRDGDLLHENTAQCDKNSEQSAISNILENNKIEEVKYSKISHSATCDSELYTEDIVLFVSDTECDSEKFVSNKKEVVENKATENVPLRDLENAEDKSCKPFTTAEKTVSLQTRLKSTLLADLSLSPPKLKIDSSSFVEIELDEVILPNKGVDSLMQKFIKHTMVHISDKKKEIRSKIVQLEKKNNASETASGDDDDTLRILLDPEVDAADSKLIKPGSKHSLLKNEIRKAIAREKERNWNKYQEEKECLYEYDSGDEHDGEESRVEKEGYEFQPAYLADDEGEEPEENDVILTDKPVAKNKYLDYEADEEDANEEDVDEDANEEDIDDDEDDGREGDVAQDDEGEDEENEENERDDDGNSEDDENSRSSFDIEENSEEAKGKCEIRELDEKREVGSECVKTTLKNKDGIFCSITDSQLVNKVYGLTSIFSQTDGISDSQVLEICTGQFASQIENAQSDQREIADMKKYGFLEDSEEIELKSQLSGEDDSDSSKNNADLSEKSKRTVVRPLSDDENDIDECESSKEEISEDGESGEEGDFEEENVDETLENVTYDSEEEIVAVGGKQFLENEAELSESEWGSDDENERGLDVLEREQGDDDQIDEDQVRTELERMHMRHMLDSDQKNIRILKEMLLEDGELHADTKRQRKFQWKNNDNNDFLLPGRFNDSDAENISEGEDEAEAQSQKIWRKTRNEREKFLSQQQDVEDGVELFAEPATGAAQLFLNKLKTTSENEPVLKSSSVDVLTVTSPNIKKTLKCGSFLSRKDQILSRIQVNNNEKMDSVKQPVNGRNFVFGAKSPVKDKPDTAPKVEKRKMIPDSSSKNAFKKVKIALDVVNPAPTKSLLFMLDQMK